MIYLIILSIIINPIAAYFINDYLDKRQEKRFKQLNEWLFTSLYSINQKVVLPIDFEKPTINKPATVFSPSKSGEAEFNGNDEGWYQ